MFNGYRENHYKQRHAKASARTAQRLLQNQSPKMQVKATIAHNESVSS